VKEREFRRQFDINVLGRLLTSKRAAQKFGEKGGSIINIGSVASTLTPPASSIYAATKSAVDGITRVLAKELGARDPVLVAELTLTPGANTKRFRYRALDRFPAVIRDVAFLADRELKYQRVLEAFASANEPLLVDVRLFDPFLDPSGEKVPMRKKSIACSLTYRATDRTLTQE